MEELLQINKQQEERIQQLETELALTKEHLKKYTAPSRSKTYYENHKKEIIEKVKEYKEEIAAKSKEYREKHKEKTLEWGRLWRDKNREKINEKRRLKYAATKQTKEMQNI
jgi:hypothetical protein